MTTATTTKTTKKTGGKGKAKKKPNPSAKPLKGGAPKEKVAKKEKAQDDAEGGVTFNALVESAPVRLVEYKAIHADLAFNVRQQYEQIADLAKDIQQVGMLSPLLVRELDKPTKEGARYTLVAGFRRYHAIAMLRDEAAKMQKATKSDAFKPPFEMVQVKVLVCDDLGADVINIRENISRNDLELWDLGDKCKRLRERHTLTARQVGDLLAYDRKTVANAERVVSNVSPDILSQVRDPALKVKPTQAILLEMAAMRKEDGAPDHDAQKGAWDEYLGRKSASASEGAEGEGEGAEGEGSGSKLGGKMMSLKKAKQVIEALEARLKEAREENPDKVDYLRGALAAAKFLAGINKSITNVRLGLTD